MEFHLLMLSPVEMNGTNWTNAHVRVMVAIIKIEANMTMQKSTRWELVVGQCTGDINSMQNA